MKIISGICSLLLVAMYFSNLMFMPANPFVFYIVNNLIILSFFTIFNLYDKPKNEIKLLLSDKEIGLFKIFNLISLFILFLFVLAFAFESAVVINSKIYFILFSVNLLFFVWSGLIELNALGMIKLKTILKK
jgi:hypothetical protein